VKDRGVPSGYVEVLNDARTPLAGFFNSLLKGTGDLALPVGGRPWLALRTPRNDWSCRGPQDPHDTSCFERPVGGDIVIPRDLGSSYWLDVLGDWLQESAWRYCREAQPGNGDSASTTDETPTLESAGLTDQVESCRS